MNPSPFKFLDSYTPQDIGSFFGRDRETGELFRQCFVSPILVVYGGSGTGKTSLVQCGLASRFQESDWLPVPVRRSGDMLNSLREEIKAHSLTPSASEDIGQLTANLYLDHFKPIYFLFDQFEELFIFGGREENEAFFQAINALLGAERNVHVVFIVREEYLAELTRYEHLVPKLIENRYRVERMARSYATDVVERLCTANGIACATGFSTAMVDRLNPEGQGVELSYLQVYLDRCWRMRKDDEPFSISLLERIGYVDDLLGTFLEEQVAETPDPEHAESLLKTFVSDQGTKRQLTAAEAHDWVNVIGTAMDLDEVERLLQLFVSKRLLRDRDERGRYELLHDALARQIFQRITRAEQELIEVRQFVLQAFGQFEKRGVKLTANDLTYLRPYRNQLHLRGEMVGFVEDAFGEEERKDRRSRRIRLLVSLVTVIALVATGVYAFQLYQQAERDRIHKQSAELSARAMEVFAADPWSAYLIAERAFELDQSIEAERVLINVFPYLYPEVARFKGNGFWHMPYSKVLVVLDARSGEVSCVDEDGRLRWSRTMPNLHLQGITTCDTAGIILLRGKHTVAMGYRGNVLFEWPGDRLRVFKGDKELYVLDSLKLVLLGADKPPEIIPLDATGEHRALVHARVLHMDIPAQQLVSIRKDTVHVFDLDGGGLKMVGTWQGGYPLGQYIYAAGSGEFVVTGQDRLVHFARSLDGGFGVVATVDLASSGISLASSRIYQDRSNGLAISGSSSAFYDFAERMLHPLIGMQHLDFFIEALPAEGRFVYVRPIENETGVGGTILTSTYDGHVEVTLQTIANIGDLRSRKLNELRIYSRVPETGRLLISEINDHGDTLAMTTLATLTVEDPTNRFTQDPRLAGNISEPARSGFKGTLHTLLTKDGRQHRLLTPAGLEPDISYLLHERSDRMAVIYSDSLVSLLDVQSNTLSSGGLYWPACRNDGGIAGAGIQGDSLTYTIWHETKGEEHFSLPLRSCLDTIGGGSGDIAGNMVTFWTSNMAFAERKVFQSRWDKGFLVDLERRHVVDTGSFVHPARYYELPNKDGFIRIRSGGVEFFDLNAKKTGQISLPDPQSTSIHVAGNRLLVLDRVAKDTVDVVDLVSRSRSSFYLPRIKIPKEVIEQLEFDNASSLWMDDQDIFYATVPTATNNTTLLVVEKDGRVLTMDAGFGIMELVADGKHGVLLDQAISMERSKNGSLYTGAFDRRILRYDAQEHAMLPVSGFSEPYFEIGPENLRNVKRAGEVLLTLDKESSAGICGGDLYSNMRVVSGFERFPLSGSEVIRIVREEKRFGEFWKHIDVEPLLKVPEQ